LTLHLIPSPPAAAWPHGLNLRVIIADCVMIWYLVYNYFWFNEGKEFMRRLAEELKEDGIVVEDQQ